MANADSIPPPRRTCIACSVLLLGHAMAAMALAETPVSLSAPATPTTPTGDWDAVAEILSSRCVACHGADEDKGGLRLHSRAALMAGGETGGDIAKLIMERVHLPDDDDERMPPLGKDKRPRLTPEQCVALEAWMKAGMNWGGETELAATMPGERSAMAALDVRSLAIHPADIRLEFPQDKQSTTMIATLADGTQRDVGKFAKLSLETEGEPVATLASGHMLVPLRDGAAKLVARFLGKEAVATVAVSRMDQQRPLAFAADVLPVLTRHGCNSGGCHGSARGQDGFHISLFGFDPAQDYNALTRQMIGRRVNLAAPEESLLLTKATGQAPHAGGKRIDPDSEAYRVLLDWLKAGAQPDPSGTPEPVGISIKPGKLLLAGTGRTIPLRVRASYKDGSDRDVTGLAVFSSSNAECAAVDEHGVLVSKNRGESFVMARFHTFTEGVEVIVIPDGEPYQRADEPGGNVVDQLVGDKLERLRITPSPVCPDQVFLRRVTLDINGRVPSLEEQDAFAADTAPDKRARCIDRLLERKEFTEIWVMKWAELLQIRTNDQGGMNYKATLLYFNWLQDRIARNVPLDEITRDLLCASGGGFANPAANFYQSEMDKLKFAENVAQAFLGTRMQCAQCHNHPFDRWTMDDYYGWAAFFSQIGRKKGNDPRETIVFNSGSGGVQHPVTKADVAPKFPGGEQPDCSGKDRRALVATWLTAPDNPFFARNVANIVWAHFFGIGIVEPVDDVRLSNPPSNPELLDALAARLRESRYNLRDLVRLIANSHAYQRVTAPNPTNALDERNFARARVRRIRAEILQDTLATQTGTQNKFKGLPLGAGAVQIADGNVSNYFLTTFGRATRATVCSCEVKLDPNLSQALHLINGETVHQRIKEGGLIKSWLDGGKKPADVIALIYRRALARPPTDAELAGLTAHLPEKPEDITPYLEDVFWAVLNAKEFVFNH